MEDNKHNFWAEQKYTPVKLASFGTKIGGLPTYIINQEEFLWPFYTDKTTGTLMPLRFLAQIEIGKNEYAFLFLSVALVSNEVVSVFDFENDQTAVFNSKTGKWSPWIVTQKVTKIEPSWLWSTEKAVSPRQPVPTSPFWIHGYDETPEKYPNFLFQIPEAPGGIETDMQTYVFMDDRQNIVLFNRVEWMSYWDNIEYLPVPLTAAATRIGGSPSYFNKNNMWPLCYDKKNSLIPMKFLAQIEIGKNEYAFLFAGLAQDDNVSGLFDFKNDQTAVFNSKTGKWSPWIVTQKVTKIEPSWLWSPEKAVAPQPPLPTVPFWIHGYDETPEKYPNFLFQIPEAPGGIETINVDMQTYVFSNNKDDIVFFNEIY